MNIWDSHMHSHFSGDGEIAPLLMAKTAQKKGFSGITFTDHLDLDYQHNPGYFDLDIPAYQQAIAQLKQSEATDNFSILWGIELGLQLHVLEENKQILENHPFDYVIGSLHVVHGLDPYYPTYFKERSLREAYGEYYLEFYKNLEKFPFIDSVGHLDYIVRYGDRGTQLDSYEPFAEIITAILELMIKKDIALEVNTGSFRSNMLEPNPSFSIIQRFYELGGRLLTVGSDAHKPQHIGLGFEHVFPKLKECGFQEYFVFQNRKPHSIPID